MSDLDEQYLRTRTDTRKWQQDQIAQVMGAGTMQSPSTTMSVDAPAPGKAEGGTQGGTAPRPTGDIGAPITKQVPTRSVGAIEETIPVTGPFAEMVKGADPKGLEDFVNTLGIPAEHLAGAFTKGDITQTATPEEVGTKILSPFQDTLKGSLSEKQLGMLTTATGILAMAAIDPMNPALGAGKAAQAAKQLQKPEFKQALDILKSERGSVPLGGTEPPKLPAIAPEAQATIDDATKQFRMHLKGFTEELNKQRRGVLSDAKVIDLASQRKDATWAALMDLPPGTAVSPELFVAFRDTYKAGAQRMKAAAQAVKDNPGNEAAVQELMNAIGETGTATTRMFGLYAEPARTTRLMNMNLPSAGPAETVTKEAESRVKDPFIQQMHDFFKQAEATSNINPSAVTPQRIADMVSALKTDEELAVFANAMAKPGWWDMIMETWINGLLSGPVTHAANIVSNAATLAWGIPERQVAALLSRSVRPGEAAAMMGGVVESIGDAWRVAWKALKEEKPQFGGGKIEDMQKAITADALELTGTAGRAVDFLGAAIRVPGRILMASDDFFKSIAFRAELRALALRKAFQEVNEAGLGGAEAAAKIKEIQRNILTNPPESIHDAAQEFAAYVTFTRDLGEAGQKIQGAFAAKLGGVPIGRIILPFIRTPANIFKYAGERTPFALASRAVREEIAAGGERRALALAKISLGSMTMAYVGSLAAGGLITGGGPKDKNVRQLMKDATGWQPYSIKAGDKYISFARIEPLASLLGMGADAADLMGQLTKKDADELAASLVVAVSRNIANKTFVKGLAGTLNAVSSQDVHIVEKFLEKELPTILPFSSALGAIAREMDPIMRSVSSILDAFKAKTPNWSDALPPQRNIWGEAIALQGGLGPDLISPFYTSAVKADPVSQEIVRLEVPITMPSRQIEGVPLQPDEYDAYVQIAGGKPIMGGQTLHQKLEAVMKSELYKKGSDGPDGGKALLVRQWVQAYRELAKTVMQDPEQSMKYVGKQFDDLRTNVNGKRQEQAHQFSGAAPGGLNR